MNFVFISQWTSKEDHSSPLSAEPQVCLYEGIHTTQWNWNCFCPIPSWFNFTSNCFEISGENTVIHFFKTVVDGFFLLGCQSMHNMSTIYKKQHLIKSQMLIEKVGILLQQTRIADLWKMNLSFQLVISNRFQKSLCDCQKKENYSKADCCSFLSLHWLCPHICFSRHWRGDKEQQTWVVSVLPSDLGLVYSTIFQYL